MSKQLELSDKELSDVSETSDNDQEEGSNVKYFSKDIDEHTMKLMLLRFQLYIHSSSTNWACMIVENYHKRLILKGKELTEGNDNTLLRNELESVINGIEWILSSYDNDTRKHVKIVIHEEGTYVINLINTWMKEWKLTNFKGRPNEDLLIKLNNLMKECNISTQWTATNKSSKLQELKNNM